MELIGKSINEAGKWRFLAGKIIEPGNLWDFHVEFMGL